MALTFEGGDFRGWGLGGGLEEIEGTGGGGGAAHNELQSRSSVRRAGEPNVGNIGLRGTRASDSAEERVSCPG